MKTLPLSALAIVLLGAAALLAAAEEEAPPLGLQAELEVGADQAAAIEKGLAETPAWQARVEATFLREDAARATEILGAHRPDELGSVREIPPALAERLLAPLRIQGPIRSEPPPFLVLYDGQRARLASTGQHTYLQDFEIETGPDQRITRIVGLLAEGATLEVTARRDAKRLLLDLEGAWAHLIRPIPRFDTDLAGRQVTIEVPEMQVFQVRETVALPAAGGYVLAGGGKAWDGESLRLLVLEVRPTGH